MRTSQWSQRRSAVAHFGVQLRMARSHDEFRIVCRSRRTFPAATSGGVFDAPCLSRRFRECRPRGRRSPYQPRRTACMARCSSGRVRTDGHSRDRTRATSKEAEQDAGEEPLLAALFRRFSLVRTVDCMAECRSQSGPSAQRYRSEWRGGSPLPLEPF